MSSEKTQNEKKNQQIEKKVDFFERLIEICGTKQPAEIAEVLDVSYQTARNYLNGRLPETDVLIKIAERTGCSIHWLLTGEGEKYIEKDKNLDALLLSDQLKQFVRRECYAAVTEFLQTDGSDGRAFSLISKRLKTEKEPLKLPTLSENESEEPEKPEED